MRVTLVCRACYRPAPPGTAPWQPFVCKCYVVDPNSKKGKRLAREAKERERKRKEEE